MSAEEEAAWMARGGATEWASQQDSVSSLIETALNDRYPCMALPYGAQKQLAIEFGVTHTLVWLVAKRSGHVGRIRVESLHPKTVCARCGDRPARQNSIFCSPCLWVELPCEQCGELVRRRATVLAMQHSEKRREWRAAHNQPQYTGRVFCIRHCYAVWWGLNFGIGAQKRNHTGMYAPKPISEDGTDRQSRSVSDREPLDAGSNQKEIS